MSIRFRLFLLLLALAVMPLLLQRCNGRIVIKELSDHLTRQTAHLLVAKAKEQMLVMVQDHAQLWHSEGQLLEQTLRVQAAEVEKTLVHTADLSEAYRQARPPAGPPLLGQITVLKAGTILPSNSNMRLPQRFDARQSAWYKAATVRDGIVWTAPVIEPNSRRVGLTLSLALRDDAGRLLGVTALSAPFTIGGFTRGHMQAISPHSKTYLVDFDHPESPGLGFSIIGEMEPQAEAEGSQGSSPDSEKPVHEHGRGMLGLATPRWLSTDDPIDMALIRNDLKKGLGSVRQAEIGGRDHLLAYSPVGMGNAALVLVAPKHDAAADAERSSDFIRNSIDEQMRLTLFMLLGAVVAVAIAAWWAARGFTRPILELASAWKKVGQGELSTHVTPGGGGELEALGRSFNEMVPQLAERTRLRNSMELAREVHAALLPGVLPPTPGLDMAARTLPCDDTGGDAYDVLPGVHGQQELTAVLVGDVSGHGLDATLLMTTARALLRMRAQQPGDAAATVTDVNALLTRDTQGSGRFMTLFYIEMDAATRTLTWVRAGHDPAILCRAALGAFEELYGPGIPLGIDADRQYEQCQTAWPEPGDVLLVGSDGIWEARGPDGDMFGKERVRQVLRQAAHKPASDIVEALLEALRVFQAGTPTQDDVTVLVLKPLAKEDA